MDESLGIEDAEGVDVGEPAPGELASIGQDWDVVTQMLPAQWEAKAAELGAVRRLRGFGSVSSVLRVLLIHVADGCSLRETAVRASAGGLAAVSDVALLKRLRGLVRVDDAGDGQRHGHAAGRTSAAARPARSPDRWQFGLRAWCHGLDLALALRAESSNAWLR